MSLDPTSVRTEQDGDVVAQIIGGGLTNIAAVNADNELTVEDDDLEEALVSVGTDALLVEQPVHDDLNLNANVQYLDTDVTNTNPLPVNVESTGTGDEQASYQATAALSAQTTETLSFSITGGTTAEIQQVFVSSEAPFRAEIQTFDGTAATTVGQVFGEAGGAKSFKPNTSNADLYQQAGTGSGEEFRVIAENNNRSGVGESAIIHVTFDWTEL